MHEYQSNKVHSTVDRPTYTCVMLCGKWHFVACLISVEEKKTAWIIIKDSSYNVLHSCTKNHCWSAVIGIKA